MVGLRREPFVWQRVKKVQKGAQNEYESYYLAAVLGDCPKVQLHFLLTGYKNREYNIHVIGRFPKSQCLPNMFIQSACDVPACGICEE